MADTGTVVQCSFKCHHHGKKGLAQVNINIQGVKMLSEHMCACV